MDGEEDVARQHEGHAHVVRGIFLVEQEVGTDMQVAVLAFEVACRGRVAEILEFGQGHAVGFLDPGEFLVVRIDDIDPDGLVLQQFVAVVDLLLCEPAFLQDEQIDHPWGSSLRSAKTGASRFGWQA